MFDHLFGHAWRNGMLALIGRIDPQLVGAFSTLGCFFHHRGHWILVHSRHPEMVQAIRRGDAFLP